MGDGRYYTFYQFFSVISVVILSMFVISSMLIVYYRNKKNETSGNIFRMYLALSVMALLKTVELVIPACEVGFFLRCITSIMLILLVMKWLLYLNKHVFLISGFNSKYGVNMFIIFLIIISAITKGQVIISSYHFFYTQFSTFYLLTLLILSIVVLLYIFLILISKNQIHCIYKNSLSCLILTLCIFLPLVLYIFMILLNVDYLDFAEILFFITLSVMFNIIMYSQSSSGLTILAFDKIGDILQDYVFVTNVDGNVIHKNKMANQSDLFISDEKIDIDNIKNIYRIKPDIKKNSHGNEYAKLEYKNKELYFIHKHDFLKDKEEIIGHIITIIDITNLMNLLYSLEDKKEKSKETNAKLKHYSEVVYHIEKEKEINVLLEEILYSREKEMQSLIDKINLLIQNENDFLEQIDHVVCFNQRILEDVRNAVRTYRQYYGG